MGFAEGSPLLQLVSAPKAGLSIPYNNVVYLTFFIGSYWCDLCSRQEYGTGTRTPLNQHGTSGCSKYTNSLQSLACYQHS